MRDELIDLISRLVAIDSVNPALVPGGAGEPEIARFVASWAEETGWRPSGWRRRRGGRAWWSASASAGGGQTLMLCAHLDTVGVEGMADPHTPRLEGDRLHGRGAYDMKSGLASALLACREAARATYGRRRGRRGAREPRRAGGARRRTPPTPRSSPSRPSSS